MGRLLIVSSGIPARAQTTPVWRGSPRKSPLDAALVRALEHPKRRILPGRRHDAAAGASGGPGHPPILHTFQQAQPPGQKYVVKNRLLAFAFRQGINHITAL
jgi:hypothetical protein